MKRTIIALLFILGIGLTFTSCKKEADPTPSTSQKSQSATIVGTFDCLFSTPYQSDLPVIMTISQGNGDTLEIAIRDNGNDAVSDTDLQAVDSGGSGTSASVVSCDDGCYQGDFNVADGGVLSIVDGKVNLEFGVWNPLSDPSSAKDITVIEI